MKEIIRKELKEAKKELFIARRNCILAYTKAAAIVILCGFGPTTAVAAVGGTIVNKMKEETKEVPYVEEVLVDNKGNIKTTDIKEEEKQESFYKEYTDCSSLDGEYVVSYVLYTGEDVTCDNVDLVNTYEVPADRVFECQTTGIEKIDHPIDKGYSVARVYRVSENTYEKPIEDGDKEYKKVRVFTAIKSGIIGSTSFLCLRNTFFKNDSVLSNVRTDLFNSNHEYHIERKKDKVRTLKRKLKEE